MRPRIYIRGSVRPSVGPWSVSRFFFKPRNLIGNGQESLKKRHRITGKENLTNLTNLDPKIWQIWQNLTNLSAIQSSFGRIFVRTNLFLVVTHGPTDGPTDGQTDIAVHRVACSRLKTDQLLASKSRPTVNQFSKTTGLELQKNSL